jgi:transposase
MEQITTVGIDLAKSVFSLHGVDAKGKTMLRRTVRRDRLVETVAGLSPCLIGLVPGQYSTGGRTRLGHISKRGDAYLRNLLVQGARSVLQTASQHPDRLSRWALELRARRGYYRTLVAIANKNARIAWALLARDQTLRQN